MPQVNLIGFKTIVSRRGAEEAETAKRLNLRLSKTSLCSLLPLRLCVKQNTISDCRTMLVPRAPKPYPSDMPAQPPKPDFPGKLFSVAQHDIFVLCTDEERFNGLIAVIKSAKRMIRMFTYMFKDDETGKLVLAQLVDAAMRGVDVQLMIDSFGSNDTNIEFFAPLTQAGGRFHVFGTKFNLGYLVRNHQKILVADERDAVIGGFNITDNYFGRAGDASWEDFGVILSGPKASILSDYLSDLVELTEDGGIKYLKLRKLIRGWKPGNGTLQLLIGGPTNRISPWALYLKKDLERAEHLQIVAAYFSPSQSILRRIAKVTRKGGSKLVLAGKTDNKATIGAARFLYTYLLKRGAQIYEYQARPLHMKLLVIDDIAYIGSSNLDVRSLFINIEIMLRIEDTAFADYMRSIIGDMTENSDEQTLEMHRARAGIFHRIGWFCKYLMVNSFDYTIGRRIKFRLMYNQKS
jgi:cardiolipin synthase A/B